MLCGMIFFTAAVVGANRFGHAMNRLHAAGIGDTAGLLTILLALFVAAGIHFDTVKLAGIGFFMCFTSPVSSHFLCQIEYYTNPSLYKFTGKGFGAAKAGKAAALSAAEKQDETKEQISEAKES